MENVGYNLDIAGLTWCRWRRKRRFRLAAFARGDDRRRRRRRRAVRSQSSQTVDLSLGRAAVFFFK